MGSTELTRPVSLFSCACDVHNLSIAAEIFSNHMVLRVRDDEIAFPVHHQMLRPEELRSRCRAIITGIALLAGADDRGASALQIDLSNAMSAALQDVELPRRVHCLRAWRMQRFLRRNASFSGQTLL